jgi:hypothetical protein
MKTTILKQLVYLASCLALASCSSASRSGEPTGQASLAITTVPPDVMCIQITVSGSSIVTQTFPVTPDEGTVDSLSLGELPLGQDTVTGAAYGVDCDSIDTAQPTWVADKQIANIQGGVVTSLTMTFRPDNPVTGTANFVGNVVNLAAGLSAIAAVLSDGTVDAAGDLYNGYNSTTFGPVSGLSGIAKIAPSLAYDWNCALLKAGAAECWGDNYYGQLSLSYTPLVECAPKRVQLLDVGH